MDVSIRESEESSVEDDNYVYKPQFESLQPSERIGGGFGSSFPDLINREEDIECPDLNLDHCRRRFVTKKEIRSLHKAVVLNRIAAAQQGCREIVSGVPPVFTFIGLYTFFSI